MVLPKVTIPGASRFRKPVEVLKAQTYADSVRRLAPSEQDIASRILDSFETDPSPNHDQIVDGNGLGTCLVRFQDGLFVIYQLYSVSDAIERSSYKQISALFCWRSTHDNGFETISLPDWTDE